MIIYGIKVKRIDDKENYYSDFTKIGMTKTDIEIRMDEWANKWIFTGYTIEDYFSYKINNIKDFDVHNYLREVYEVTEITLRDLILKGYAGKNLLSTEFYNIDFEKAKRLIYDKYVNEKHEEWNLRLRQTEAIDFFKSIKNRYMGLFALPRFGKTRVCFKLLTDAYAEDRTSNYSLFVSDRTDTSIPVWEEYYKNLPINFKVIEKSKVENSKQFADDNYLIPTTLQDLVDNSTNDLKKYYKDLKIKYLFIDEAHRGAETQRVSKAIKLLNPEKIVLITGTPYFKSRGLKLTDSKLESLEKKDIATAKLEMQDKLFDEIEYKYVAENISEENSFVYDLYDESEDVENGVITRLDAPELKYVSAKKLVEKIGDEKFLSFIKDEKFEFVIMNYPQECVNLLASMIRHSLEHRLSHIIIRTPFGNKFTNQVYKYISDMKDSFEKNIYIYKLSGDNSDEEGYSAKNKEVISQYNREKENSISILISHTKGMQSVTYEHADALYQLNASKSVALFTQSSFRVKNPNRKKNKTECFVYDFLPDRALQTVGKRTILSKRKAPLTRATIEAFLSKSYKIGRIYDLEGEVIPEFYERVDQVMKEEVQKELLLLPAKERDQFLNFRVFNSLIKSYETINNIHFHYTPNLRYHRYSGYSGRRLDRIFNTLSILGYDSKTMSRIIYQIVEQGERSSYDRYSLLSEEGDKCDISILDPYDLRTELPIIKSLQRPAYGSPYLINGLFSSNRIYLNYENFFDLYQLLVDFKVLEAVNDNSFEVMYRKLHETELIVNYSCCNLPEFLNDGSGLTLKLPDELVFKY